MFKQILNTIKELIKPKFPTLHPNAFVQAFKADSQSLLIDVRTKAEFQSGSIPKAKNVDVNSRTFSEEISKLNPQKTYFVFCRSGARSRMAAMFMARQGLKVINLSGGYAGIKNLF